MQVVGFLHVLHPLVSLTLRVNHQWPAPRVAAKKNIFIHTAEHALLEKVKTKV
jgi:hypothetical protein